jgi:hypothetical protein
MGWKVQHSAGERQVEPWELAVVRRDCRRWPMHRTGFT